MLNDGAGRRGRVLCRFGPNRPIITAIYGAAGGATGETPCVPATVYAEALTTDPEERLLRKLFMAFCAASMSPDFRSEPISESSLVKEEAAGEADEPLEPEELVELEVDDEELDELSCESSRLVKELYADCAPFRSPELIELNRSIMSWPRPERVEEPEPVSDENPMGGGPLGAEFSKVVSALCAAEMLLLLRAEETLERKVLSGLLELELEVELELELEPELDEEFDCDICSIWLR